MDIEKELKTLIKNSIEFDLKEEDSFGFNVVGHTQLKEEPIMFETIVCLDCRKCFYANSNGDIVDYKTDKIIEKTIKPTD